MTIDPAARTDLPVHERGHLLAEMAQEEIAAGIYHSDFASQEEAEAGYPAGALEYLRDLQAAGSEDGAQMEFLRGFLSKWD